MTPRLKSSKKWTVFPQELSEQILSAFEEHFKAALTEAELIVEGRIYPEEIMLRVGILEKGRLKQKNFEISSEYSSEKDNAGEKIFLAVDAAASLLLEYLENEKSEDEDHESDLPYTWREMNFENQTLYFQFSTVNTRLEEEADRLLGLSKKDELYVEEDDVDFDENAKFEDDDGDSSSGGSTLH